MIPTVTAEDPSLTQGNVTLKSEADLPTKTYYMNLETKRISGLTDGKAAMKQAEALQQVAFGRHASVFLKELIFLYLKN